MKIDVLLLTLESNDARDATLPAYLRKKTKSHMIKIKEITHVYNDYVNKDIEKSLTGCFLLI